MKFYNFWDKIITENKTYRIILIALVLVIVVEAILINNLSKNKQVVILPPKVDKPFTVAGNTLSAEYLEQVAMYVADRVLSVSPANIDNSFSNILPFLTTDPNQAKSIRDDLLLQAKKIKDNDIYQIFYPMRVHINKDKVVVEGLLKKLTGNTYYGEERVNFAIYFTVENGRFLITKLEVE